MTSLEWRNHWTPTSVVHIELSRAIILRIRIRMNRLIVLLLRGKGNIIIRQSHQTRKLFHICKEGNEVTAEKRKKRLFGYSSSTHYSVNRRRKGRRGIARFALQSFERAPSSSSQDGGIWWALRRRTSTGASPVHIRPLPYLYSSSKISKRTNGKCKFRRPYVL